MLPQTLPLDKDQIRLRLDLRTLAEEAGARFQGDSSPCPLHGGDNPTAFHLYDRGRKWHCFTRCPEGANDGDLFTFYMRWRNVDFKTALRDLAARAHLPYAAPAAPIPRSTPSQAALTIRLPRPKPAAAIPAWRKRAGELVAFAHHNLLDPRDGARARAYLQSERGLGPDAWHAFRLGFIPAPIYDDPARWGLTGAKKIYLPAGLLIPSFIDGRPFALKARLPAGPDDPLADYLPPPTTNTRRRAKFIAVRGSGTALFGPDLWIGHPLLLLVEGEWDALLCWNLARDLCDVATLGSAVRLPSPADLSALSAYPLILAVHDADAAGDRARERLSAIPRIRVLPPPAHDLTDYWHTGGDLRRWLAARLAPALQELLSACRSTPEEWRSLLVQIQSAANID